ncbi:hypothetical protein F8C76_03005 [Flagellimonas olearia]|uniref:O-antigen ligase-related domain-containing protein n=1 Tax=Flagellimonas olearia TaxID=552546 RepID=A0A6I1E3K6_9FLAO|nr:O-antigen ligase family protein [Allomuricauda olearia]KAB7530491.1 hypothetical protein F8C76_03005 [Allomuricauda olearia]
MGQIAIVFVILNIPSAVARYIGFGLSGVLNYLMLLLLAVYYVVSDKSKPTFPLLITGFSYYFISSFNYIEEPNDIIQEFLKFVVVVLSGTEIMKRTNNKQLFYLYLIGAFSILIHAMFGVSPNGRFSGLYLNPNEAGFVCISGYALCYSLKNRLTGLLGQFCFTFLGLLTFSRTFIVIWIIVNILAIYVNIKNIRMFAFGFLTLLALFFFESELGLNNVRLQQLKSLVHTENGSMDQIDKQSRTETWAAFYEPIMNKPILGNGYGTFQGVLDRNELGLNYGAHNTYLLLAGEAGFLPFLLFIAFIGFLMTRSIFFLKQHPHLFLQSFALAFWCLASHNFFNFYYVIFSSLWIYYQIKSVIDEQ